MTSTITIEQILAKKVVVFSQDIYNNHGVQLSLRDILFKRVNNLIPDNRPLTPEEKLNCTTKVSFQSSESDRSSGVLAVPNGLVMVDIDDFKHELSSGHWTESEFINNTNALLKYLRCRPNYIASWLSSSRGVHCIMALNFNERWSDINYAKYQIKSYLSDINEELLPRFNCSPDFQFTNLKQLTFVPDREIHVTDKDIIALPDLYDYTEQTSKLIIKNSNNNEEASHEFVLNFISNKVDTYCNMISNNNSAVSHKPTNEIYMGCVRDYAKYVNSNLDSDIDSDFMDKCKNSLLDACKQSSFKENAYNRETLILHEFNRHFNAGLLSKNANDYVIYQPAEKTKEILMEAKPYELNYDSNLPFPKQTKDLKGKSVKETMQDMINAFLAYYRTVPTNNGKTIIDIISGRKYKQSVFTEAKKVISWTAVDTDGSIVNVSLGEALNMPNLPKTDIQVISSYAYPARSLVKTSTSYDDDIVEDCFNEKAPVYTSNMENYDLTEYPEVKFDADLLLDFIKDRFNTEEDPERCIAYYCKYMISMCDYYTIKVNAAMGFFSQNIGGTGKTTLAYIIPTFLIGGIHSSKAHFSSNDPFSLGIEDKLLGYFDEITSLSVGDQDRIKTLIESGAATIHRKYQDKRMEETRFRLTATGNHPHDFHLGSEDRRWSIFNIAHSIPTKYYDIIKSLKHITDARTCEWSNMYKHEKVLRYALYNNMKNYYKTYESTHGIIDIETVINNKSREDIIQDTKMLDKNVAAAINIFMDTDAAAYKIGDKEITRDKAFILTNFCKLVTLKTNMQISKTPEGVLKRSFLDSGFFKFESSCNKHGTRIALTDEGKAYIEKISGEQLVEDEEIEAESVYKIDDSKQLVLDLDLD